MTSSATAAAFLTAIFLIALAAPYIASHYLGHGWAPLILSSVIFIIIICATVAHYQQRIRMLETVVHVPSPAICRSSEIYDLYANFYDDEEYEEKMRQLVYA